MRWLYIISLDGSLPESPNGNFIVAHAIDVHTAPTTGAPPVIEFVASMQQKFSN